MLDKYKYFVTDPLNVITQVFPLGKPTITWDKNTDNFKHDYDLKIAGDLTFQNNPKQGIADFDLFYALETATNRCDYFYLSIHKLCGGLYIPDWKQGRISLNAGKWDLDKCKVTFSLDKFDKFSCIDDHKDDDFDIFNVTDRQTIDLIQGTVETITCQRDGNIVTPTGCPSGNGWIMYYSRIFYDTDGRHETQKFARYNVGGGVYKPAIIYNPTTSTDIDGASVIQYLVSGIDGPLFIDNGVLLKDVFQMMISTYCGDMTLRSDFFQWNPNNPSDINYVTGDTSLVNNLILFQKSDVKRPDVSNNATNGQFSKLTLDKLLTNICTMFNCNWDIVGNDFIIEHISWWANTAGLDLTQPRYTTEPYNYMKYSNRYSYTRDEMPKYENFSFMEASNYDFFDKTISYDSACVSNKQDSNKKDYKADIITTDINFVMSHPSDQDELVSDEGFCLIACDSLNRMITLDFDFSFPNNSLSWTYLLKTYYLHGRVLLNGFIDGEPIEFVSAIKTRLQDKIIIPLCECDPYNDAFIPTDLITTFLGNDGEVKSAVFNMKEETLELNLVFGNEGAIILTPVARSDNFTVLWNILTILNILANDTASAGIDNTTVVITQAPAHGTATVNTDGTLNYTPTTDYLGSDILKYTVKDINGAVSNIANVYINVVKRCSGVAPAITSIIRNNDNSITIFGTAESGSTINVFGSVTETGLLTQINTDYTEADLVAGITLTSDEVASYGFIKVHSINADCDFGYSNAFAIPVAFTVTWQGVGTQVCLTNSFGDNTGYLVYPTRERLINGIADGYTEPNTEGTGIGTYIEPVYDVAACSPYLDENPVFFNETDETKTIEWTDQRRAIYGDMPTFQVWVYNENGIPERTNVPLSADDTPPDQTVYTYYNSGAKGYIEIQGNKDVLANGATDTSGGGSGGSGSGGGGGGSTSFTTMTWTIEGVDRTAEVWQPTGTNLPILFAWHGRNGTGPGFARKKFESYFTQDVIVVYPTGLPTLSPTSTGWQHSVGEVNPYTGITDQDLKFYDAMLLYFTPFIDTSKILNHGFSNGGEFTYDCLWVARQSTLMAICCSSSLLNTTSGKTQIPVMHTAGLSDPYVNFTAQKNKTDDIKTLNSCSPTGSMWATGSYGVLATKYPSSVSADVIFLQYDAGHSYTSNVPALIVKFFEELI